MADLSEFSWVDPDELHLVKTPANGFPLPLLAKAAAELDALRGQGARHPLPDAAHVQDALDRFADTKFNSESAKRKAAQRLMRAAFKYGVGVSPTDDVARAARKEHQMGAKKKFRKALQDVQVGSPRLTKAVAQAWGLTPGALVGALKKAAVRAEAEGNHLAAGGLRREAAEMAIAATLRHPNNVSRQRFGQGVPLIKNSRALPEDADLRYA